MTIVKTETVDGKRVEIHEDRHGKRRYWIMIDGCGLFQHGRMRIRTFATIEAALDTAREEVNPVKHNR